jgi:hypothetical protein
MGLSKRLISIAALAAVCLSTSVAAFAPPQVKTLPDQSSTALSVSRIPRNDGSGLPYGERSRPYRRSFFTQPDWENHRSRDRFFGNLLTFFKSGVVRQLKKELFIMASASTFIWGFNSFGVAGWEDFQGIQHEGLLPFFRTLEMPSVFFTLSSPSLSLLLGKKQSADHFNYAGIIATPNLTTYFPHPSSFQDQHFLWSLGRST